MAVGDAVGRCGRGAVEELGRVEDEDLVAGDLDDRREPRLEPGDARRPGGAVLEANAEPGPELLLLGPTRRLG